MAGGRAWTGYDETDTLDVADHLCFNHLHWEVAVVSDDAESGYQYVALETVAA